MFEYSLSCVYEIISIHYYENTIHSIIYQLSSAKPEIGSLELSTRDCLVVGYQRVREGNHFKSTLLFLFCQDLLAVSTLE